MSNETNRNRYILPYLRRGDYNTLMKLISPKLSDPVIFRIHVLDHYTKYGWKSASDAFGIPKSTLYDWKRLYEVSGNEPVSLVPKSTRPHRTRMMATDYRLVGFIKQMRKDYGNVGANIVKPFLDLYAQKQGISTVGLTTITKIIKRRRLTFEQKVYVPRKFKFKKLRTRRSPNVTSPGFIQMDSIVVYINKERHLFMSIMDVYTKYALVEYVPRLSSTVAKEVFTKFRSLNPTSISIVQTDNGSEFLGAFHDEVTLLHLTHQFIYPRLPKVNGFIERFNRTVQEEFILRNDDIYYDLDSFREKLNKYLAWYNYQRPHSSLKYVSPMKFISTIIPKSV
jgi:putative transposase